MKRTAEPGDPDYLTDDDRKTLESIFGCMTAVMGA
jgi:hypothetical protein